MHVLIATGVYYLEYKRTSILVIYMYSYYNYMEIVESMEMPTNPLRLIQYYSLYISALSLIVRLAKSFPTQQKEDIIHNALPLRNNQCVFLSITEDCHGYSLFVLCQLFLTMLYLW